MKKKGLIKIWLAAFWIVCLLAAVGGATYAWFTFDPYTAVTPVSSTVSSGDAALLIGTDINGEFSAQCVLPQSVSTGLRPVSTQTLEHFYRSVSQNRQGISISYTDATQQVDEDTIHGICYLKSLTDDCDVFFHLPGMSFGTDPQVLSALRLGIRFVSDTEQYSYIYTLDAMGNTAEAVSRQTTDQTAVVVGSIDGNGTALYVPDPSVSISGYGAEQVPGHPDAPNAGANKLGTLSAGEIATVEYWLYLEGCDANCINEVQDREVSMQLSFAGVIKKDEQNLTE